MSHGLINPLVEEPAHDLLSATHTDTTADTPVRGDVVIAQQAVSGAQAPLDYWIDGAPFAGVSDDNDPAGLPYWLDGAPMPEFSPATVAGAVKWARLARGTAGQFLGVGPTNVVGFFDPTTVAAAFTGATAYQTAAQSIPWNTLTTIEFDATVFDTGSHWSSGQPSRLTAAKTGLYIVVGQVARDVSLGSCLLKLSVNGTVTAQADASELDSDATVQYDSIAAQVTAIVSLTAGDYVELLMHHLRTTHAAVSSKAGSGYTFLSIAKVG